MVIGDNPEAQLAPFSEELEVPEYVRGMVSKKDLDSFVNLYTTFNPNRGYAKLSAAEVDENLSLTTEELYEKYGDDWNSNVWRKVWDWKKFKKVWKEFSTYNPDSKWDWCSLGGRWRGFFKVFDKRKSRLGESGSGGNKPLYDADQSVKGNINFEWMKAKAQWNAMERWGKAHEILGHLPYNRSWDVVRREYKDIGKARDIYGNQLRVKAVEEYEEKDHDFFSFNAGADEFLVDQDAYIGNAGRDYMTTFAVLKDGKWYQRGEMGWWGIVTDRKEDSQWDIEFNKLIADLPDDTLLSVYDCHI